MKSRFIQSVAVPLCLAAIGLAVSRPGAAQVVASSVCPADSTGGRVDDGQGAYRPGTTAREYVVSFLSTNPGSISRTSTGTSGVDPAMVTLLSSRTDKAACGRLNAFMNNGESQASASPPWVYFRAGSFYFIARWTPPQPLSNYTLQHQGVMVFDANFNLLGVWTA